MDVDKFIDKYGGERLQTAFSEALVRRTPAFQFSGTSAGREKQEFRVWA